MKQVDLKIKSFKDIAKVLKANIPLFFIITLVIFAVFIGGIKGEFVSDDVPGIVREPKVHDINKAVNTYNVQLITYAAVNSVFGLNPVPFHAFSILLHTVNVFLFFLIIYNIFNKKVAAISSLLYSVHSVNAETVNWISAVNYLLSNFSLYICIILYLMYKKTKNKKLLIALFGFYALVTITLPNYWVLIIPFIVAGIDFFILERNYNFKSLLHIIPLFVIGILSFFIVRENAIVTERVARLNTADSTPYINRIPFSIYNNAELLIFPNKLTIYHEGEPLSKVKYRVMILVSVIIIGTTTFLWFNKKTRLIGGMIFLMFISILPVFSPVLVAWMVAERYLYFTVGLFTTLLAMLILKLDKRFKIKNLAVIITFILLVAYSGRSFARTLDWRTRKSLWLSAEKKGPFSARAHNNLGDVYGVEGNWEKSIWHFRRAIEINPYYSEAFHNLGNTLMQLGQYEKATILLLRSLEINPALHQSMHKLGLIEYQLGNSETAMGYFVKTLEIKPDYLPAIQSIQALQTLQQRNQ